MGPASARSGSSGRRACTIRAPSPWSMAPPRQCRGYSATRTSTMTDKPMTEPAEGEPAQSSTETPDAIGELQRERDELYDRLLRKTAEFDNYRKRIDRERREQADQTVTRF